jgi:glycosyltransferase involved in cell wall biosynthesis
MKAVFLGTYDKGKPRTRILLRGLKENHVQITECHESIWENVEDKSQAGGAFRILKIVFSHLVAYPKLIYRYLNLPPHDVVIIGYLGLFDVLILWPFIRLRKKKLVWDIFLSLYNTVVEDRQLLSRFNPLAVLLYLMEWTAIRIADIALMDTLEHANYIRSLYKVADNKVLRVFVGVETDYFKESTKPDCGNNDFSVLFYGQFIPLHGIEIIIEAAKLCEDTGTKWTVIGKGQETPKIQKLITKLKPTSLQSIEWVPYKELNKQLACADVVLGIFGKTDKATRVIPNKIYQALAANKPVITADTPAIRELLKPSGLYQLIPAYDAKALADAVMRLKNDHVDNSYTNFPVGSISSKSVCYPLLDKLRAIE